MQLKRGTKHSSKDLIFWQYHHPFFKETNGEVWLTPDEFNRRKDEHAISTTKYRKTYPLVSLVARSGI